MPRYIECGKCFAILRRLGDCPENDEGFYDKKLRFRITLQNDNDKYFTL